MFTLTPPGGAPGMPVPPPNGTTAPGWPGCAIITWGCAITCGRAITCPWTTGAGVAITCPWTTGAGVASTCPCTWTGTGVAIAACGWWTVTTCPWTSPSTGIACPWTTCPCWAGTDGFISTSTALGAGTSSGRVPLPRSHRETSSIAVFFLENCKSSALSYYFLGARPPAAGGESSSRRSGGATTAEPRGRLLSGASRW